jgi:hypothetical protein
MEVTDKLSFLDLIHVVLSKDFAIPFVSRTSKCKLLDALLFLELWILLQSS